MSNKLQKNFIEINAQNEVITKKGSDKKVSLFVFPDRQKKK